MNEKGIILLGGGGHAKVLIDLIKTSTKYALQGILDPQLKAGSSIAGVSVLGKDTLLEELYKDGAMMACMGIGSIRANTNRKNLFIKAKEIGYTFPNLIHNSSVVSEEAVISEGVQIMAGAILQAGSQAGENTIINTRAIIEHDCIIGKHAHICSGTVLSGGCIVDEGAFIGAGATVKQGIRIGRGCVIGAGSVVVDNVPDRVTVKGVPAK